MAFYLGIITARAGSKGIVGKNLKPLNGVPLIAHTIREALLSKNLSDCLVSTESEEIAQVSLEHGAAVPFMRPPELALDTTKSVDVVRHAIEAYEAKNNKRVDHAVILQPTSPLRLASDIDEAITLYETDGRAQSLVTCFETAAAHPRIMYLRDGNRGIPFLGKPDQQEGRRQDFGSVLVRNGAVFISSRELIMTGNKVMDDQPLVYVMPESRSVNIDDPVDLELAEFWLKKNQ